MFEKTFKDDEYFADKSSFWRTKYQEFDLSNLKKKQCK